MSIASLSLSLGPVVLCPDLSVVQPAVCYPHNTSSSLGETGWLLCSYGSNLMSFSEDGVSGVTMLNPHDGAALRAVLGGGSSEAQDPIPALRIVAPELALSNLTHSAH